MKNPFNEFRIPTILGLSIIIAAVAAGIIFNLRQQTLISQASPAVTAQNVTVSNVSDTSVAISWQTASPVASFIRFGQYNPDEQTVLDDRDGKNLHSYWTHYFTLKNLSPDAVYQYRIISGQVASGIFKFTTAAPLPSQTGLAPVIGSVLSKNTPLKDAIVYLSIADAATQSALTKTEGNFLIPISQIRKADLSDLFPLTDDSVAKLTILSQQGKAFVLFKLKGLKLGLPPITLGENLDLTSSNDNIDYDLNGDGKINSADVSIILQNFGSAPRSQQSAVIFKKADLNNDGVVDQKDLDLMLDRIKKTGNQ